MLEEGEHLYDFTREGEDSFPRNILLVLEKAGATTYDYFFFT